MRFLFMLLFCFVPLVHANEHLGSEQQGALSYHLPNDPEMVLQFVQMLLDKKCNTGENPVACSANEILEEQCNTDNPAPLCLSEQGILLAVSSAFYPHIPALHFSPQELNQRFNPHSPPINLLSSDPRDYLKSQGRPGEFIDTSYTPPFFIDDNGNAVPLLKAFYRLKDKSSSLLNNNQQEVFYLQFPERDMKLACNVQDELTSPEYCLGWIDPENRPETR